MHKEIETQPVIKNLIKDRFGEVFKFLSDLVSKSYTILIVLDKKPKELDEVVASLPVETRVIEFKTFETDGNDIPSHAHEFETLFGVLPRPLVEKGIWIPAIVEAFHRLGGPGKFYHRKEIFEMVVKVKSELRNRGRTPDKTLDFYLGTNSRGKRKDLFEPKKEGSGYWMLKRMIRTP